MKKVIIIGGGASGLIAAIAAKRHGADVTIIERNIKLGKKILATGNGRCNFTNVDAEPIHYNNPTFVKSVFEQFSPQDTLLFFKSLGITPKIEDLGKTYPLSEQASSITDVLIYEVKRLGIEVVYETVILSAHKDSKGFVLYDQKGESFYCDRLIISTGGLALPQSGSDGTGYQIAKDLGHEITKLFPALVKLKLDSPYLKQLDGVKFPGFVTLIHNQTPIQTEFGDILFTKYGISGPTILQLSRKANALLSNHESVFIDVKLVSELSVDQIYDRLLELKNLPVELALLGLINRKIVAVVLKEAHLMADVRIDQLKPNQIKLLANILSSMKFKVTGSKGYEEAQVTAGGVNCDEINPVTLESLKAKGLYFSGEVMDIDGLCGGYNLQWAWSSGYIAGLYATK
ncbi:NAD(P)/FAD-dependent oxidoreductase [Acholeplasma vituli]|uniref:NAD(P)/FAD-dependent oxidoreductase n=1 Tax=Paracholeplasma vituli TaxID=69473 RepID=A0ABT2Q0K2_9MOLU|nr:NAD(P)/FAD-dependent oxidoreductase [Paracholeplasma vituli]MCU0105487.1 NAD(P)/FAD-dependent oxidoreductase [Paracholeplasma vituli]